MIFKYAKIELQEEEKQTIYLTSQGRNYVFIENFTKLQAQIQLTGQI